MLTESRLESDVNTAVDLGATSFANKATNVEDLSNLVRSIATTWLPSGIIASQVPVAA